MSTVLITGASRGLGRALALAFAEASEHHIILLAREEAALSELSRQLNRKGKRSDYYCCDVSESTHLTKTCQEVLNAHGAPDVLVNNVGRYRQATFEQSSLDDFRHLLDINLLSQIQITQAFLPAMRKRGYGDLIFIGSVASHRGFDDGCAYTVSKHAQLGLVRSLREETKHEGIRVLYASPGAIDTDSWNDCEVDRQDLMPAEDIANLIVTAQSLDRRTVMENIIIRPQAGDL